MARITSESNVTRDPRNKALRTWFDMEGIPGAKAPFRPNEVAFQTLQENAELFAWEPQLPSLKDRGVVESENSFSVRFSQEFKGIPVDSSEVVVNIFSDGRVYSIYNNYHYDIPKDLKTDNVLTEGQAREIVEGSLRDLKAHEVSKGQLIVYQYHRSDNHPPKAQSRSTMIDRFLPASNEGPLDQKEGQHFLAWDFTVVTRGPAMNLRFLVDAVIGNLVNVIDLAFYASGTADVFDPNPVVTSGDTGLSWGSPIATLDAERVSVTVPRLNAADGLGNLHLDGTFAQMREFESPAVAEPLSGTGDFSFSSNDDSFLNAMAYFHIDRIQNYFQTDLAITSAANFSIEIDPQGLEGGGDNSHYLSVEKRIAFGVRNATAGPQYNPVPDAADAMVILHEYGHAIQDNMAPGFSGFNGGVGEGFGDFLAAVYYDDKHQVPANTRGIQMSFDANTTDAGWPGRRYDKSTKFDEAGFTGAGGYGRAEVWASAMFELYRKLGGDSQYSWVKSAARDLAIRLHLMATPLVPVSGSTVSQWGQQILAQDSNLGGWRYANGLHKKVINDTFSRRHLATFNALASDVYIDDGRNGGYGSTSGNDLFTEKLFLDNYWSTQDLWVKTSPYIDDATQQAGGPGDHIEPPVGSLAYLYVRVKNKGTAGSGSVTVKAYHSDPTIGLVWPADWTPTDAPSQTVSDIPANGSHIFGPFPWTPVHVGHECVFAIAECDQDRAVTQDLLATDVVGHSDLVPFDNNIAQRNLQPTMAKGKMSKGFWVSNPTFEKAVVKLDFESTLPKGWNFHTNLANTEAIHLAARERRWVEVTIDQAGGAEIRDFANPPTLIISGSINGRLIGGMSFYAAPASAFPGHSQPGSEGITDGAGSAICRRLKWLMPILLALMLILLAVAPAVWTVPVVVIGLILILLSVAYWFRRCKPGWCDLLCALILGLSLASLLLGILILADSGSAAMVFLLALLSVIDGVLVIVGALAGCCGHCQKGN